MSRNTDNVIDEKDRTDELEALRAAIAEVEDLLAELASGLRSRATKPDSEPTSFRANSKSGPRDER